MSRILIIGAVKNGDVTFDDDLLNVPSGQFPKWSEQNERDRQKELCRHNEGSAFDERVPNGLSLVRLWLVGPHLHLVIF